MSSLNGIRTRATGVKDQHPGPLDDETVPAEGFEPPNLLRVIEALFQAELYGPR